MDPNLVVWIGIFLGMVQIALVRILDYYYPKDHHRPGPVKDDEVKKDAEDNAEK